MNVEIADRDTFNGMNSVTVTQYLESTGWTQFVGSVNEIGIWDKASASGEQYRVWVPLNPHFSDYAEVMAQLFGTLAQVEQRSQLQILEDIETVNIGDIIRFRTEDSLSQHVGTLPLQDGMDLLRRAHDATAAAAQSVVDPRAVYSRRFEQVASYLKRVRVGQTERGSYLIKIISPLLKAKPQPQQLTIESVMPQPQSLPFERQVVITLVSGLRALQDAATSVERKGAFDINPFEQVVRQGVSANLCEAIVSQPRSSSIKFLEINVIWSHLWEPPSIEPVTIHFSNRLMPYIAQAAQALRERHPEDIMLQGYVIALRRERIGDPNSVIVNGAIERQMRNVRFTLNNQDYDQAIRAHERGFKISVIGTLRRQGKSFWLENAANFHILESNFE